ncbi:MAG: hypothetical protein OEV87_08130 [Phycisphaerae bacterium]|nr:hypothetical protein [Phycisphaerae bacterium]
MKKAFLLAVMVLSVSGMTIAEDVAKEPKLGVTLDLTYTSKWLSKGVEAYRSHGGFFETLDLDFYGTGLGVKVTHRSATGSGFVDSQRFDYRPYYKGSLFEDESYKTNYDLSVGYEHYYGLSRTKANTTYETILACSWPQLLGGGLVPKYVAHYETPATSGVAPHNAKAGWVHRFILDYNIDVAELPKPLKLSSEIGYYDGLGGKSKDSDWMYTTFGLSTGFELSKGLSLAPGLYYQHSMDDDLNPGRKHDILYTMVSMKYAF